MNVMAPQGVPVLATTATLTPANLTLVSRALEIDLKTSLSLQEILQPKSVDEPQRPWQDPDICW